MTPAPQPRLSVIIPTLDEARNIASLLEDLNPLRQAGHEIIIADGGSTDRTRTLAEPLCDRLISAPRGRALQMNAGASASKGALLWFVHADTRVPSAAIDTLLKAAADPDFNWSRFDVRLSGSRWVFRVIERLMNLRSCATGIATGDQGIVVRRTLFERAGRFPEIPLMEDIALSKRLRQLERPACLRPPLVASSRRWETRGIGRTILLMWRLRLAYALGADPERLAARYYPGIVNLEAGIRS